MKYNPAFLSDDELKASFVAREREFQQIIDRFRAGSGEKATNFLITGPRGSGKTTLALRIAAEIRSDEGLSKEYMVIQFPEESYELTTIGEFWLQALRLLSQQYPDGSYHRIIDDLSAIDDSQYLAKKALKHLQKITIAKKVRLVFIVENFDMLIESQFSPDDVKKLQKTLRTEPTLQVLATAISNFPDLEVDNGELQDLFEVIELQPLDEKQCQAIWGAMTGEMPEDGRIKALHILTGGNPRLLTIISSFGAEKSFKQLMDDLIQLVDDHTDYFKGQLDHLAPVERKVFTTLARLWEPSTAREVSEAARLDVSKTSSLLHRLMKRGKVELVDQKGRVKWYQVAEKLFNIYYLMRRCGTSSGRVKALVDFMVVWYGHKQTTKLITEEALQLDAESRALHFTAYEELMKAPCGFLRKKLIEETQQSFFDLPDTPDSIRVLVDPTFVTFDEIGLKEPGPDDLVKFGVALLRKPNQLELAASVFRRAVEMNPDDTYAWMNLGIVYHLLDELPKAEKAICKAIASHPEAGPLWEILGHLLTDFPDRQDEAAQAFLKATQLEPQDPSPWFGLGMLYDDQMGRYEEAEKAFRKAIEIDADFLQGWEGLGRVLDCRFSRSREAEEAYRKAIELGSFAFGPYINCTLILLKRLDCCLEAFEPIDTYLQRTELVKSTMDSAIETFSWLTALNCGPILLELIEKSPSAEILEPLIVGIKLYLGEDMKAPAQVLEVGEDVKKRILEYHIQMQDKPGGDTPPPE